MWLYPVPFDLHKVDKDPEACAPSSFSPGFVIRIEHVRRRLISCDDIYLGVVSSNAATTWNGLPSLYPKNRAGKVCPNNTPRCALPKAADRALSFARYCARLYAVTRVCATRSAHF